MRNTAPQTVELRAATSPTLSGQVQPSVQRAVEQEAGDKKLKLLARALGRQAARRHMHRGYSLLEIALCLTLGALVVAALWYGGLLHSDLGQHR